MDSWHAAGSNIIEGAKRYMLKFHYVRMEEPSLSGPCWDHDPAQREWTPQADDVTPRASAATWDWLCGGGVDDNQQAPATAEGGDSRDVGAPPLHAPANTVQPTQRCSRENDRGLRV